MLYVQAPLSVKLSLYCTDWKEIEPESLLLIHLKGCSVWLLSCVRLFGPHVL